MLIHQVMDQALVACAIGASYWRGELQAIPRLSLEGASLIVVSLPSMCLQLAPTMLLGLWQGVAPGSGSLSRGAAPQAFSSPGLFLMTLMNNLPLLPTLFFWIISFKEEHLLLFKIGWHDLTTYTQLSVSPTLLPKCFSVSHLLAKELQFSTDTW